MNKLTIVPTPIGNLGDITLRSIEVLKAADIVLAEDTRTSGNLFKHLNIEANFQPFHQHNEHKVLGNIIKLIQEGKKIALVSDAGTPGISDPGFLLIRECITNGIEVDCLPGATAFVPALVNSGFPSEKFCFEGFLPHKKGRQKILTELKEETRTMVFYESPHRIIKTLEQFGEFFGMDRSVSISREITKKFEETVRGNVQELLNHFKEHPPKGEFVIVVAGREKTKIKKNKYHQEEE